MSIKFNWRKVRPGMRVIKSGLAVFLVILLFNIMGWEGVQISALTAVFSLREDFDSSIHFGSSRILGNSIGGLCAILYFLIEQATGSAHWVTLIFVPIFTMMTITANVALNNKAGVIGGVSAFLIIALSVPSGSRIIYSLVRVFETFVGVFIAILVNSDWRAIKRKYIDKKQC